VHDAVARDEGRELFFGQLETFFPTGLLTLPSPHQHPAVPHEPYPFFSFFFQRSFSLRMDEKCQRLPPIEIRSFSKNPLLDDDFRQRPSSEYFTRDKRPPGGSILIIPPISDLGSFSFQGWIAVFFPPFAALHMRQKSIFFHTMPMTVHAFFFFLCADQLRPLISTFSGFELRQHRPVPRRIPKHSLLLPRFLGFLAKFLSGGLQAFGIIPNLTIRPLHSR